MDESPWCPECFSDDIQIDSIRDCYPLRGRANRSYSDRERTVARIYWIKCNTCGHTGPETRRLV